MTDARGLKATYLYDGFDRLKEWHFPDPNFAQAASATDYEAYTYDANGNMLERRLRDDTAAAPSKLVYTYDALIRQASRRSSGDTIQIRPQITCGDGTEGALPAHCRRAHCGGRSSALRAPRATS